MKNFELSYFSLYLNFSVFLPISTFGVEGLLGLELKRNYHYEQGQLLKQHNILFQKTKILAALSHGKVIN